MRIPFAIPHVFTRDSSPREDEEVWSVLRRTFDEVARVLHPQSPPARLTSTGRGTRELRVPGFSTPTLTVCPGWAVFDFGREVFHKECDPRDNALVLEALMAALVDINVLYRTAQTESGRIVLPLYKSGVVYERTTAWDSIPALYRRQYGDCKSLTAARVAELLRAGQEAVPTYRWTYNAKGDRDFHILVMTPQSWEDPSKKLGMGADENGPVVSNEAGSWFQRVFA